MSEKTKGKHTDNEHSGHGQGSDVNNNAHASDSYKADNVADESFEDNDSSSEVSCGFDEWKDKYMRLSAEFDNYRKRTLREKMDLISTGSEGVVKSLLGVMDDIDRAVDAMGKTDNIESVREGVTLISQKLKDMLKSKGVSEVDAAGKDMDADLFEAVARIPAEEGMKGKVVDVVQKGYKLNDKVIRYAKVVVGE